MTSKERTVQDVLDAHPDLGYGGFTCGHIGPPQRPGCRHFDCGQPREVTDRDLAALRTAQSLVVIETVAALLDPCRYTKAVSGSSPGSYGLKHATERRLADDPVVRGYVSNGQLIAAALLCGFPVRRYGDGSPNAGVGIYRADVRAIESA